MYYCESCKKFVPGSWSPGEPKCSNCGSEWLEPAKKCPVCGEWTTDIWGCEWCRSNAVEYIKRSFSHIREKEKRMAFLDLLSDVCVSLWVDEKEGRNGV